MADLQTVSIDISKIKVRWEEPYSSEALNRVQSVIPRGVCRGLFVSPAVTPDQTFSLKYDPDSSGVYVDNAFMYYDQANGFGAFVRDSAEPSFDMSARFSSGGAIPGGGEKWWVWADVDYATGLATTGDYHVTLNGDPIPDDAVIFGTLIFSGGETTIQSANCSVVDATVPFPTKREDGAYVSGDQIYGWISGSEAWNVPSLAQKQGLNATPNTPSTANPFVTKADTMDKWFGEPYFSEHASLVGVSKVQLSGYFYIGDGFTEEASYYFSLRNFSDYRYQLYSSSTGESIRVSVVYRSDDSIPVVPSTDADAEGFYKDPYVYFEDDSGAHSFTGDLRVHCYRKKEFSAIEQAPAEALPNAGMPYFPHIDRIRVKAATGSPDSISRGDGQSVMESMLGLVNDRIKTIHPTATSTSPVLLWRSNAKTTDLSVTKDTSSLYWADGQFAIVVGGYLDAGDIVAGIGVGDVSMFQLTSGGIQSFVKKDPTAGTDWSYTTLYLWDTVYDQDSGKHVLQGDTTIIGLLKFEMSGYDPSMIQGMLSTSTQRFKLFESTNPASTAKVRVLYGMGSDAEIWITFNADWLNASIEWSADVADGSMDASAISIGGAGPVLYKVDKVNVLAASGTWADWQDSGVRKQMLYPHGGGRTHVGDVVDGENLVEVIRFGWSRVTSVTGVDYFGDICNFRAVWEPAPVVGEMTFGVPLQNIQGAGSFATLVAGNINSINNYGFRVEVGTSVSAGEQCRYDGFVTVST